MIQDATPFMTGNADPYTPGLMFEPGRGAIVDIDDLMPMPIIEEMMAKARDFATAAGF